MPASSSRGPLMVLAALTDELTSTEALYQRMGYPTLLRAGLISYPAFRRALRELEGEGLAASQLNEDGPTLWRRTELGAEHGGIR